MQEQRKKEKKTDMAKVTITSIFMILKYQKQPEYAIINKLHKSYHINAMEHKIVFKNYSIIWIY